MQVVLQLNAPARSTREVIHKMFFEYPPYGKLIRHRCQKEGGLLKGRKKFPIVVKTPKGLLGEPYYSCAVCGKMFRDEGSLKDHFNAQRKNDLEHKMFLNNKFYINIRFIIKLENVGKKA